MSHIITGDQQKLVIMQRQIPGIPTMETAGMQLQMNW